MSHAAKQARRTILSALASLILFAFGQFTAAPAAAQTSALIAEQTAQALAALTPESRAALDRLATLRQLTDGAWKMHAGDLAHGEAVDLDESSWQLIANRAAAPKDAVWFRHTYVVPPTINGYDLTGARLWFQFHADANGPMPQILYFNGRRVAMGDDLEPIVLLDQCRPGDKVVVAVKLLHTVDDKRFRGATLRIEFPSTRPNPEDLRLEFLSAAYLVPSLAPHDPAQMVTLNVAIQTVDLKALAAGDQSKFDLSLTAADSRLQALKPLLTQATFHLTGNAHIDAAWLWPWTETVDVVKRTFGTALQLMYEYPDYTYTQSAAAYNEWMSQKYPEMNDEIKRRIQEGRWEIVGGMWVEPDLNMPDGESLVRQLLVGKRWYKQAYGVDVRIGWNPDSFGYTWQLPQIYKKSGVDYFVTQKMTWNDTNQLPFKLFWWESPDGSKVLAYFPHDYVNLDMNPDRLANDLVTARNRAPGMTNMMDLYGVGDHGGGPTRAILDEASHWAAGSPHPDSSSTSACNESGHDLSRAERAVSNDSGHDSSHADSTVSNESGHDLSRAESAAKKEGASAPAASCFVTPRYEFGTAQTWFTAVEKQIAPASPEWNYQSIAKGYTAPPEVADQVSIPTWKSELYFEYHRGVMTSQANHKRNMRDAEEQVLNAEKFSSIAWLYGTKYPAAKITEDWKKVLFNQFHDLAAGSGIGVIYKDAQKDYDVVRWSTNEIDAGALGKVAENIDTSKVSKSKGVVSLVVFNPLGWMRSGTVVAQIPGYPGGFTLDDPSTRWHEISFRLLRAEKFNPRTGDYGAETYLIPVSDVPAFGYKTLRITPGCDEKACHESDDTTILDDDDLKPNNHSMWLDNGYIHVKVDDASGCITSVVDKKSGTESIAPGACGNQLQFFKDTPKDYDAWNIDPGTLDQEPTVIEKADSVGYFRGADYASTIIVTSHWQNSKFVQTIRLEGDQVDIENDIDWHEAHVLLKAAFPVAAYGPFATYEIPYGTIDRPTTRNNSWEKAQFEVAAMRWADLGDGRHGLSILNNSKYGYDAVGDTIRITLLRSPKWPDPEADMGHHHFHYALYPHAGTWKDALTVRHGWEYNYPLTAVVTTAHPGSLPAEHSFASVSPENVVLTAVKKAEDQNGLGVDGLILRVYEWAGKQSTVEFHIPPGATSATVTNMMEIPEGDPLPVTGDVVKVPIKPYEILTIRVDYPNAGPKS
jgi:alpha-mannosidase